MLIPRGYVGDSETPGPCWIACVDTEGRPVKPAIRCNCQKYVGIGLHHVHADGRVTASFFHSKGTNWRIGEDPEGCGWHVNIELADYDQGDFPAEAMPA